MTIEIKPIELKELQLYKNNAMKAGLTFLSKTKYYGCYENDVLVGFTGVNFYRNKATFKTSYVIPEKRRNGYYSKMFDYRIDLVKQKGIKLIEATCTKMSLQFFLNKGAKIVKQYYKYAKVKLYL